MRLYSGTTEQLQEDTTRNQVAGKLADAFFRYFRFHPSPSEIQSWQNSLRALCLTFHRARLDDHGVMLEYQLPLTSKRLDCLVCGKDDDRRDQAVIVELKQWERCSESDGEDLVSTWLAGTLRDVLHPSVQVARYRRYLQDTHTTFYEGLDPVGLSSCAYLHNYSSEPGEVLFLERYAPALLDSPTFTADDSEELTEFLRERLLRGQGIPTLQRIEQGRYRPSKKLMEHVANVINGLPQYVLLDEQQVVYSKVFARARAGFHDRRKTVLIVRGGPGTGKSVIAINLMADLLRGGYNAQYATGSKAFTETLRKIIGSRGAAQFNYFNNYAEADLNAVDVLICDEAHRIRETSVSRFTPKTSRSGLPQVRELLNAAKTSVFFVDDRQVVRPGEIGSSTYLEDQARQANCEILHFRLEAQFRCAGSDGFVNWVDNTLAVERTANVLWQPSAAFDFQIVDSPEALDLAIRDKARTGASARLTAGFCWPWSPPKPDGTLVEDVVIGDFRRPWNAKPDAGRLAKGIPRASLWATGRGGLDQIGCVYTAQGFEFDYVGVIFGPDLVYRLDRQSWLGQPSMSHDSVVKKSGERFTDLVKNTYRVLLSRGLKGCYVHFMDRETELFFRSRMEPAPVVELTTATKAMPMPTPLLEESPTPLPFRILESHEVDPYQNCVPIYDLAAAAGRFSGPQIPTESLLGEEIEHPERFRWAELPEELRPRTGLFVAQVVGESMNRRIPSGSWCLFRLRPEGTRHGRVVLVQHRAIEDPETGGSYSVKVYNSEKALGPEGEWTHRRIVLRPDSDRAGYEAIVLTEKDEEAAQVIAELIAVLS